MARKSRKNLPQPEQAMVSVQFPELDEEKIPTAIYGRLSVEDDEDNESMETQIALVQNFINRSGELNYVDTYFDNRSQNFLDVLEEGFKEFFEKEVSNNPLKAEYFQEV